MQFSFINLCIILLGNGFSEALRNLSLLPNTGLFLHEKFGGSLTIGLAYARFPLFCARDCIASMLVKISLTPPNPTPCGSLWRRLPSMNFIRLRRILHSDHHLRSVFRRLPPRKTRDLHVLYRCAIARCRVSPVS